MNENKFVFTWTMALFMTVYATSWYISYETPYDGLIFLLIVSLVLNLYAIMKRLFIGIIVGGFLAILGIFIPFLLPFILLLPLLFRFTELIKNLGLILIGFVLYFSAWYFPNILPSTNFGFWDAEYKLLAFIIGLGIMFLNYFILSKLGYKIKHITFYTIGLPAYILVILIPFVGHHSTHDFQDNSAK